MTATLTIGAATALDIRGAILALEAEMRRQASIGESGSLIEIEPVHYFAEGLYAREVLIPKGTLVTGKIHLCEHLNIVSKGDISVLTEDGLKRVIAPATFASKPGTKKCCYAHEDTVWTTVHACCETDPAKVEAQLVVETFEQFELAEKERPCPLLP